MNKIFKKMGFNKKISFLASVFVLFTFVVFPVSVSYGQALPPPVSRPPVSTPGGVCTGPSDDKNNPCYTYGKSATYALLEPLPCVNGNGVSCTPGTQKTDVSFKDYVQYMFNLLIALAAVSAVFMIVLGGFEYMTSDAPGGKSGGRKKVENAVYGLLLVLSSFLILKTIDPRLVNIPSTLVKPLDIKYKPDELSEFFVQLNSDADNFKAETTALRYNNNEIQKLIDAKKIQRDALCNKLITENTAGPINIVPYKDECHAIMAQSSTLSPEAQVIVAQIANLDNQQKDLEIKRDTNMAIGTLNIKIRDCYTIRTAATGGLGTNLSTTDCLNAIATTQSIYMKKLSDVGATVEAQKIKDYGTYATAIAKINANTLIIMSSDPYVRATIDTAQNVVTATTMGAGAAIGGGVVGAVGGFVVAQSFNTVVNAVWANSNKVDAQRAISTIQQEVNNSASQITDPAIRTQFTAQAYNLIKSLGGKGDGTDSVAQAAPQATSAEAKASIDIQRKKAADNAP